VRQHLTRIILILVLGGVGLLVMPRGPVAAQSRVAAQDQDVLPALLAEVRGLRVAMEQIAGAGPRVQLAMGRLQLQEQRVNTLLRRLDEVRANLSNTERESESIRQRLQQFELALQTKDSPDPPDRRRQIELEMGEMRAMLPQKEADVLRLQTEEAAASQQLALEQGRWNDINKSLEDLERALATRK
jgi:hypothetical protein